MSLQALVNSIQQLHQQLEQHEPLDANARKALIQMMEEIQRALENSPTETGVVDSDHAEQQTSLASQISDWVAELEAKHPQLTQTLSQIADRLSDMGI